MADASFPPNPAFLFATSAAVSNMERGKVQVSASDLSILANVLNKPIEFFYGKEVGDSDVQDLFAIIRKQSPEIRQQSIATIKMLLRMQNIRDALVREPEDQPSFEEIRVFVRIL